MPDQCGQCRRVVNHDERACFICGAIRQGALGSMELSLVTVGIVAGTILAALVLGEILHAHYLSAAKCAVAMFVVLSVIEWLIRRARARVQWHLPR
jgi:hypothetical protein